MEQHKNDLLPGTLNYYSITRAGRKQLTAEEKSWQRTSAIMTRLLEPSEENT